jgi:asparagine synthase (glutamine-hydrolysing)
MCGITGIIDLRATPDRSLLEKMCRIMIHRGPDGEGYYIDGPLALGHRRLSIIDLESGKQPMSNEDGTIWITYNGEIYNFPELRKELIDKGHRFKTRSDTETIIHAYEEYGFECLKRLKGMFAFGIWDKRKKVLFVARDRLGKKPLYYYAKESKFIFGSELKALSINCHRDTMQLFESFKIRLFESFKIRLFETFEMFKERMFKAFEAFKERMFKAFELFEMIVITKRLKTFKIRLFEMFKTK